MKTIVKPIILLLFLGMIFFSCSKDCDIYESDSGNLIQGKLQAMVDQLLTNYKTKYPGYPGGLALKVISKNGTFFVSSGLGQGVTDKIHFRAASNTKLFTSTAILLLAQEGKLKITARIIDTIPGTNMTYVPMDDNYNIPYRDQITIGQLMHHTAGVFDVTNFDIPDTVSAQVPYKGMNYLTYTELQNPSHTFTFDELVGVDATCRLFNFIPGQAYKYSNTGYSILGKIIERVSGQSYSQYVTEKIFQPMGLSNSSMVYKGDDQLIPPPFAKGYFYKPEVVECTQSNMSCNVAEGNLITTPENLARFLRTLLRGEGVLTSYWVNTFLLGIPKTPPDVNNYACGIFYALNLGWGHNGAHEGYLSRMVSDPQTDITTVVFTNSWNTVNGLVNIGEQLSNLLDEACYKAKYIVQ